MRLYGKINDNPVVVVFENEYGLDLDSISFFEDDRGILGSSITKWVGADDKARFISEIVKQFPVAGYEVPYHSEEYA